MVSIVVFTISPLAAEDTLLTQQANSQPVYNYVNKVIQKLERIGNAYLESLNHHPPLRGKLAIETEIKHDGRLVSVTILQTSEDQSVDAVAKRIVYLATPFEPFPDKLKDDAEHIEIIRRWTFSTDGLHTDW